MVSHAFSKSIFKGSAALPRWILDAFYLRIFNSSDFAALDSQFIFGVDVVGVQRASSRLVTLGSRRRRSCHAAAAYNSRRTRPDHAQGRDAGRAGGQGRQGGGEGGRESTARQQLRRHGRPRLEGVGVPRWQAGQQRRDLETPAGCGGPHGTLVFQTRDFLKQKEKKV